ncbi:GNAT family N-acetyltransferase, partial [Staphylococcus aureus]|uniref:GNAT family N-acetyltransferase n=1 Tax=Staphylococcus aureus TaxID=1280 RepID=UPI00210A3E69
AEKQHTINYEVLCNLSRRLPRIYHDGDQRYRKRGIGKVVMEKLASFITSTFQDINEIVLTVNTDKPHAMALYRQQGYQYMGDSMFVGRPVHIMALTIK